MYLTLSINLPNHTYDKHDIFNKRTIPVPGIFDHDDHLEGIAYAAVQAGVHTAYKTVDNLCNNSNIPTYRWYLTIPLPHDTLPYLTSPYLGFFYELNNHLITSRFSVHSIT